MFIIGAAGGDHAVELKGTSAGIDNLVVSADPTKVEEFTPSGPLSLGVHELKKGVNKLKLENIPPNPSEVQITEKPGKAELDGRRLEFMVTQDFVRKATELWSMPIRSIEPAYYPYWLVRHKGRNILIDAMNKSLEHDMIRIIGKFI